MDFFVVFEVVDFLLPVFEVVFAVFFLVSEVRPMIAKQSSKVRSEASFQSLGIL